MQINFSKMHGLGNDFMVVDNVTQNVYFSQEKIQQLADRHFGIGFDQLLMVEPPYDPDQDFHYRIFNADGSEVSQCGNGARCFARFVKLKGLINKNKIMVSTKAGKMVLYLEKESGVWIPKLASSPLLLVVTDKVFMVRGSRLIRRLFGLFQKMELSSSGNTYRLAMLPRTRWTLRRTSAGESPRDITSCKPVPL